MWVGEEMKMSDVFELPFKPIDYQNGIVDSNGFGVLFADFDETEKLALCDAVNNHDRLVEENRRLTKLAAQKASRADELFELLEQLVNPENCRKDVIHLMSEADSLLDKIKQEIKE